MRCGASSWRLRAFRHGWGEWRGRGRGPRGWKNRLTELAHKIDEVTGTAGEEEFGFFALRLPGGEPATLHKVVAALTELLAIVDGADAAPTADAQQAAQQWEGAGADVLARWKSVEGDLVGVNAVLEKAGLKPLLK